MRDFFNVLSESEKIAFYAVCVSVIVAVISLLGTISTAVASAKNRKSSEKANRINLIVSNRVEWINKLREQLATYCSKLYYDPYKDFDAFINDYKNEVIPLAAEIKMHLNLKGEPDKELVYVLNTIDISIQCIWLFNEYKLKKIKEKELSDFLLTNYSTLLHTITLERKDDLIEKIKLYIKKTGNKSKDDFTKSDYAMDFFNENLNEFIKRIVNLIPQRIKSGAKFVELLGKIYLKAEWDRVRYEAAGGKKSSKKFYEFYDETKNTVIDEYNQLKKNFE